VSTNSLDSAFSESENHSSGGRMSRRARCAQFAAFAVCFALTFGLSFFLVQLASEQGMDVPEGNSSSTWSTMSVRAMVRKRAATAGRGGGSGRGGNVDQVTTSGGEKGRATAPARIKREAQHDSAAVGAHRNIATTGSLRPNVKPARKLTAEKASAADRALEEDLNILEKMKSSSNSDDATNTNLGLLSAELENTTTLLGDDARLNADTQIVKELKQTFSGRSDGAQRL
jgi:hypothetical protein